MHGPETTPLQQGSLPRRASHCLRVGRVAGFLPPAALPGLRRRASPASSGPAAAAAGTKAHRPQLREANGCSGLPTQAGQQGSEDPGRSGRSPLLTCSRSALPRSAGPAVTYFPLQSKT